MHSLPCPLHCTVHAGGHGNERIDGRPTTQSGVIGAWVVRSGCPPQPRGGVVTPSATFSATSAASCTSPPLSSCSSFAPANRVANRLRSSAVDNAKQQQQPPPADARTRGTAVLGWVHRVHQSEARRSNSNITAKTEVQRTTAGRVHLATTAEVHCNRTKERTTMETVHQSNGPSVRPSVDRSNPTERTPRTAQHSTAQRSTHTNNRTTERPNNRTTTERPNE